MTTVDDDIKAAQRRLESEERRAEEQKMAAQKRVQEQIRAREQPARECIWRVLSQPAANHWLMYGSRGQQYPAASYDMTPCDSIPYFKGAIDGLLADPLHAYYYPDQKRLDVWRKVSIAPSMPPLNRLEILMDDVRAWFKK